MWKLYRTELVIQNKLKIKAEEKNRSCFDYDTEISVGLMVISTSPSTVPQISITHKFWTNLMLDNLQLILKH